MLAPLWCERVAATLDEYSAQIHAEKPFTKLGQVTTHPFQQCSHFIELRGIESLRKDLEEKETVILKEFGCISGSPSNADYRSSCCLTKFV